ncbi:MAG TPA: A/G-specific adenine glycosylase [Bacteroidales bacterium]|nr:A/G-specific adenine glycosylase [Bacteroidales bacterium]HNS46371.1 A/G-specific adenine glycosylase [Bacteroidales bacterium]
MNRKKAIRTLLMEWYERCKRDLPWRHTTDPYSIWISEVILQQTRVDQGKDYYLKFMDQFPDVRSLAKADEQDVLRLWQGLGYYTRARNVLKAARIIHERHHDLVPDTYDSLTALPGIGDYTASAILSIAFGQAFPVLDGNVSRVIARLMAVTDAVDSPDGHLQITSTARDLADGPAPGTFNQAIMEFGALHCKPVRPDCNHCVLRPYCQAFKRNLAGEIPVRKPKANPRKRYLNYLVINARYPAARIVLKKRTSRDVWMNMFDFPLIESDALLSVDELITLPVFRQWFPGRIPSIAEISETDHHILSHQHLYVKYFLISIDDTADIRLQDSWVLAGHGQLKNFPLPRLITRFLEKNLLLMGNK